METANELNKSPEIWQVEVNGQIYETDLTEMQQWIAEGSLLPADKVRRGNLRWLEANKVPVLYGFFNARELGIEPPKVSTTFNQPANTNSPATANFSNTQNFTENNVESINAVIPNSANINYPPQSKADNSFTELNAQNVCILHAEAEAKFICRTCSNAFCKICPKSYSTVKICPMCGAMCEALTETKQKQDKQVKFHNAALEGFGFSDFGRALAFPFKYKVSLFGGAILYMFFTLGQGAAALGGVFLIVAAIFCAMLANMLTFGVLANTVDNFSQGKLETNFMPSFDNFELWDDMIHPFFLSIGAYLSSFGPLILIIAAMFYFVISSAKSEMNAVSQKAVSTVAPEAQEDYNDASQTGQIKGITDKIKDINNQHNEQIESVQNNGANTVQPRVNDEEKRFQDLNNQINQSRKQELESTFGKTPETEKAEFNQFAQKLLAVGIPFLLLAGIAFLWGLFYFPAACCVAGYTGNFSSTINPLVGLDTIKRLGIDYVKILGMTFLLALISIVINSVVRAVLSPFDLPKMGNLPAIAIGSFITFYLSVVFSVILGYALYKNSDKLNLYR